MQLNDWIVFPLRSLQYESCVLRTIAIENLRLHVIQSEFLLFSIKSFYNRSLNALFWLIWDILAILWGFINLWKIYFWVPVPHCVPNLSSTYLNLLASYILENCYKYTPPLPSHDILVGKDVLWIMCRLI